MNIEIKSKEIINNEFSNNEIIKKALDNAKTNIKHLSKYEESKIDFKIPASWKIIPELRKEIINNFNFSLDKSNDYEVCLGEALNNALEHGCKLGNPLKQKENLEKKIDFFIKKSNHHLKIEITTPSEGFDYQKFENQAKIFKEKRIEEISKQSGDLSKIKLSNNQIDEILAGINDADFNLSSEGGRGSVIQAFVNEGTAKYENSGKTISLTFQIEK